MSEDKFLHNLTAVELLERFVRGARVRGGNKHHKHSRWVAVSEASSLGAGYSHDLCRKFNLDPDEEVKR